MRALAVLATLALLSAACTPRPDRLEVPMSYRPTASPPGTAVSTSGSTLLYLSPVIDGRTTVVAGENVEDGGHVQVLPVGSPTEFLHDTVVRELAALGVRLSPGRERATHVMTLRLTRFLTIEKDTYVTEVRADVEIRNASGEVLYTGVATGADSRWGKSLSAENYQETWTAACTDLARALLRSGDVTRALRATE